MAKSDLLKQAIADAKAVKETALANAKLALQEAFAPRLESMLQSKLIGEIEGEEEEMDVNMDMDADVDAGMEDDAMAADVPDSVNVGLDFNDDGEYDLTGMVGGEEEMGAEEMEAGAGEMEAGAEDMEAGAEEDDLNLEEILRELEETEPTAEAPVDEMYHEGEEEMMANEGDYSHEEDINEIIEAILRETEMPGDEATAEVDALKTENEELEKNLEEAYRTVKHLKSVINEVNLLNAKLLYTNKLFRNFDLNEGQKMKVIENFDRAVSTREVKLVFSTLAESFRRPTKKAVVKEHKNIASKVAGTTRPTQIISEGNEMALRFKKLAGLL